MKKLAALTLAAAMVFSMAACGNGDAANTGQESNSDSSNANTEESKESAESTAPENQDPQEIVTVKWVLPGDPQEGTPEVLEAINEKLAKEGLALDLQLEPFGSYNDKMNMMISSQEEFDLCFTTGGWMNFYLPNVAKGAFVDITDMIDEYAPELKDAIPDFLFDQVRVKDRIYAVPNYQISYTCCGLIVQTQFLEKYNFDLNTVTKYEDLEPFLQNIVENEPGYYPLLWEIGTLDYNNDYILVDESAGIRICFAKDDPEMKVMFQKDLERQLCALGNDWWKKGYVRSDKATIVDDTADRIAGKYVVYGGAVIKPGGEVERTSATKDSIAFTQIGLTVPFVSSISGRSSMTAISSSSKHPEAAMKLLNIVNTDKEIFNLLNYGLEGRDYTKNAEEKVVKAENPKYFLNAGWSIGNQFNAYLLDGQADGIWEETDRINREADISPISGFSFDQANVSSEIAKIAAVKEEYKNLAFFDNWEEQFDEYMNKLDAAGLDTYLAEIQRQLDEWRAENQ